MAFSSKMPIYLQQQTSLLLLLLSFYFLPWHMRLAHGPLKKVWPPSRSDRPVPANHNPSSNTGRFDWRTAQRRALWDRRWRPLINNTDGCRWWVTCSVSLIGWRSEAMCSAPVDNAPWKYKLIESLQMIHICELGLQRSCIVCACGNIIQGLIPSNSVNNQMRAAKHLTINFTKIFTWRLKAGLCFIGHSSNTPHN